MYEVIKNVIQNGAYILSDMLVEIDTSWIRGYITEEEKSELIRLARDNADYTMELNTVQKLKELESRVKALEEKDITTNPEDYSEYVSGKWYYKDNKITYNKNITSASLRSDRYVLGILMNIQLIGKK